ncbi:MAG: hypothetical protein K0S39_2764 [Paenibacillus sp.]|jgi:Ger(x)C family germination protein|nr:hypothetical protein [Paenibacillus sp.]
MRVIVALLLLLFCAGCWDKREINELAIVNIAAADKDPDTGLITAYYQVINPTGISAKQGGTTSAPVYTFEFKENSFGKFAWSTSMVMPRLFFTPHVQCYIVSERYAKQGLLEFINFLERDPDRRTNVDFVVTDFPLSTLMYSYTPLERVPGRYIRSVMDMHARTFHKNIFPSRIKDIAEGFSFQQPIIIPILHYSGDQSSSSTDRLENINASKNAMRFSDGAVFMHARMVGRVDRETKTLYFILNGKLNKFSESIQVNGSTVIVDVQSINVRRKYEHSAHRLTLKIDAVLRILDNKQKTPMNVQNLQEIEMAFNRTIEQKAETFVQFTKDKGWDLLGIQDEGSDRETWDKVKINFNINSEVIGIGNTSASYK